MSIHRHAPRALLFALALGTGCAAWAALAGWTGSRPDAGRSERLAVSQPAGSATLASVPDRRNRPTAMDHPVTAPTAGSRPAGRELLAKRLASEKTGHAARLGLLARRPIPTRGLASGSALRVQLERAFDAEIERLTARVAEEVGAVPGNS